MGWWALYCRWSAFRVSLKPSLEAVLKGHPQRGDTTRVLPVCLLASGVGSYAYSRWAVLQLGHHLQPCIDVWSGDRVFECGTETPGMRTAGHRAACCRMHACVSVTVC